LFNNQLFNPSQLGNLKISWSDHTKVWAASAFLVSVPVFFQAPLVRHFPVLSLIMSVGWLAIAQVLLDRTADDRAQVRGSLIWGFSLTWLCGSIYWGWLRFEPLWHLPIEAIAMPWAIWAIGNTEDKTTGKYAIGAWFYISSLLGTAITDLYFYLANLLPHWQAIIKLENDPSAVQAIFQDAVLQLQTPSAIAWAVIITAVITAIGFKAMRSPSLAAWAFAGALLSTIFVDALFAVLACLS
jgi:hypothetical protein